MIFDANGNELIYWPISGLIEGENSDTLDFTVEVPATVASLTTTLDSRVNVWVKKVGDVAFVNISETSYDLTGLGPGDVDFQIYLEALTPIEGLERIPITITAGVAYSAGWVT